MHVQVVRARAPVQKISDLTDAIIRDHVAYSAPMEDSLHLLVGHTLGRLHGIKRSYPGWVALEEEDSWDWAENFFASLENRIQAAVSRRPKLAAREDALSAYVEAARSAWLGPDFFSLSRGDGIQAIIHRDRDEWSLSGLIDVEDHFFTDRSFALAALDLIWPISPAFRAAYEVHSSWPANIPQTKGIYQLYLLTTWLSVMVDFALRSGRSTSEVESLEERIIALMSDG